MMTLSLSQKKNGRIPADVGPDIAASVYEAGCDEWNLRYGSAVMGERILKKVVVVVVPTLAAMVLALLVALVALALRNDVRVFAVPVNGKGVQIAAPVPVTNVINATDAEKQDILEQWAVNAFSVTPDSIQEKRFLDFVRTHSTAAAYQMVSDYFSGPKKDGSLSPFVRAQKETVEVQIVRVDTISPETYQLTWTEIERDFSGHEIHRKTVVGTFAVATVQNDPSFVASNVFGVDVTRFSLSQDNGATQ
jgi:type IV secretion system protein VirB5